MTRFARASGSKASNERVPNEPTPWYEMKQQLQNTSQKQEEPKTKTKSAKELLKEKDDIYYPESLGNVKSEWAEFDVPKGQSKKTKDETKKVEKKVKKSKPDKIAQKNNETDSLPVTEKNIDDTQDSTKKRKKKKNKSDNVTGEDSPNKRPKILTDVTMAEPAVVKKKEKRKLSDENTQENPEMSKGPSEPKKKKKKTNDKKENTDSNESKTENAQKTGPHERLSKRQKRNMKKRTVKDEPSEKNENTNTFSTTDDKWSNNINFGKKQNLNNSNENPGSENRPNFREQNFGRGNIVPQKRQRKPPKIRDDKEHKPRKPDPGLIKMNINGVELEIIKYDGFPIKKEDAERLKNVKQQMILKGIPKKDIDAAMKLERRKAEKALARARKHVCFHCRKAGHNLSECPELGTEQTGTGICFKCGSTEHTHFECRTNRTEEYRFAKCFICREQGHVAKQCPDNPKGLYPDGGSCKICGDVTHLKKDCPDLLKEKEESAITLATMTGDRLESLEDGPKPNKVEVKKKIVKF